MKKITLNNKSYYNFLKSTLSIDDIVNFSIQNNLSYASIIDENMHGAIEFYNKCLNNQIKPIIGFDFKLNNNYYCLIAKNFEGYKVLTKINSYLNLNREFSIVDLVNNNNLFIITDDKKILKPNHVFFKDEVCFNPIYAKNEDDNKIIEIMNCIKHDQKTSLYNLNELKPSNNYLNFNFEYDEISIQNTNYIIENTNLVIPNNINNFVDFKIPENYNDKNKYFYDLVYTNLVKKTKDFLDLDKQVYIDRLNSEFELIKQKNFVDYFLVVSDFINYAKSKKIVIGPGRGSAAGSLISYALNITELDPIKYNLLFERFLNQARISMPDIDIDVMDIKRDKIITYLINKYDWKNVAQIITFSKFKAKMAIRDVGRVLGMSIEIVDKISKKIPLEFENDIDGAIENSIELQELYAENKDLFEIAKKLIGLPRQHSIHAAGIILANNPIWDIAPVCMSADDNKLLTQYSMEFLEQLGLIKIDLLSLKNLTIIDTILKMIKALKGIDLDLYSINFEDQNVYKLLSDAKTLGIFQFESIGMQGMLKKLQPSKLEDLSIVSAIYRPGPSQFANVLIDNKKNPNKIEYLHPSLKPILKETYGIILYQEQIINIAQKIASFNETESDLFRKAISKKDEQKIIALKNNFISGALKNGYSEEIANAIFKQMLDFASYGFNHSHSISYALISYFLAYLKYYFPLETFTVLLSNLSDKNKLNEYKKEALELNIILRTPNINLSSTNFILRGNEIFFAFNAINGIGEEIAKKIITLRELQENKKFDYPEQAIFLLSKAKISKKNIESLILSGVFDDFNLGREYLIKVSEIIINSKSILMDNLLEQTKKFRLELGCDVNSANYAFYEKELLNVSITKSGYDKLFDKFSNLNNNINSVIYSKNSLVLIKESEIKISRKNEEYLAIKAILLNEDVEIFMYSDFKNLMLENNCYYLVSIKNLERLNKKKFILQKVIRKVKYE